MAAISKTQAVTIAAVLVAIISAVGVTVWQAISSPAATPALESLAIAGPGLAKPTAVLEIAGGVNGVVRAADGKPLAGYEVFLATAGVDVVIYAPDQRAAGLLTGPDGRFSFPANVTNRAIVVRGEQGYAQVSLAELEGANGQVTIQPWARVEGVLRQGTRALPNETVHLSRTRFGSPYEASTYRATHDTLTRTDADGRFVFPRVAPGQAWLSWRMERPRTYDVQYRYLEIEGGQTVMADIGGVGRPLIGRVTLSPPDKPVRLYGSLWHMAQKMLPPADWSQMSEQAQAAYTRKWEQTPEGKAYNVEKCPIDFDVQPDGTFRIDDVPAGAYYIFIAAWSGAPAAKGSEITARGSVRFGVAEMSGGRSDEPQDVGIVNVAFEQRLEIGQQAPTFDVAGLDGTPIKLSDFQGKYLLLHFWRSDDKRSLEEIRNLIAAEDKWGADGRLAIMGLSADITVDSARKFVADNKMTWPQGFLGIFSNLTKQYRLNGPTVFLIAPDGTIVAPSLRGRKIEEALQNALGNK